MIDCLRDRQRESLVTAKTTKVASAPPPRPSLPGGPRGEGRLPPPPPDQPAPGTPPLGKPSRRLCLHRCGEVRPDLTIAPYDSCLLLLLRTGGCSGLLLGDLRRLHLLLLLRSGGGTRVLLGDLRRLHLEKFRWTCDCNSVSTRVNDFPLRGGCEAWRGLKYYFSFGNYLSFR